MEEVEVMAVVDTNFARAAQVAEQLGCKWFESVDDLIASKLQFEAASIAAPTIFHEGLAKKFLGQGVHCLVEKPLAESSIAAQRLVEAAKAGERVLIPGHVERFNPGVMAVKKERPKINYIKGYRVGPMSFRSTDTDVVMDVMIHDIDLALYLARGEDVRVEVIRAVGSPEGVNDVANAHLRIGEGCFADLTASRLAIARRRKLRMFTDDGYYSIDCGRGSAMKLRRTKYYEGLRGLKLYQDIIGEPTPEQIFAMVGAESIAEPGTRESGDGLSFELNYFIQAVRGKSGGDVVTAEDGVRAIEVAEQVMGLLTKGDTIEPDVSFRA
jgi:predicted dehydrogenase